MNLRIVLTAFLNENYLEEAKMCIESIRRNGKFKGQIDLITDFNVEIESVNVVVVDDCFTIPESAAFRLKTLKLLKWVETDVFLYLDTDVMVLKPLDTLCNYISDEIGVYGFPNRTQKVSSFAGFLSNDLKIIDQKSFCTGILLFKASQIVLKVFNETWDFYIKHINDGKEINSCWEQPFLCLKLIEYNLYNVCLNELVYEERSKKISSNDPFFVSNATSSSALFNHFCGLRGNKRKLLMKKYL